MFDNCAVRRTALARILHLSGGYHVPIHHQVSPEITANLSVGSLDGAILAVGEHAQHERHLIRELRKQLGHRPVLAYALNPTAHGRFRDLTRVEAQGLQKCRLDACLGPVADCESLVQLLDQQLLRAHSSLAMDGKSSILHPDAREELTLRERQILELLGQGRSFKNIAQELGISIQTGYTHGKRIRRKLQLETHAQLLSFAAHANISGFQAHIRVS